MSRASTRTRSKCREEETLERIRAALEAEIRTPPTDPGTTTEIKQYDAVTRPEMRRFSTRCNVPPAALEQGGIEVLRAVDRRDGALHMSLRRAFDDPEALGHAARRSSRAMSRSIYATETSSTKDETVERIRRRIRAGSRGWMRRPIPGTHQLAD